MLKRMSKWFPRFNKLKYRHKIAIIIFSFTLLPIVILGLFLTLRIWDGKVDDILTNNRAQLSGRVNNIDSLISSSEEKMQFINSNYYIYNFLYNNADLDLLEIMSFNDYLNSMVHAVNVDNSRMNLSIYAMQDTTYNNNGLRSIKALENIVGGDGESIKDEILKYPDGEILWKARKMRQNYTSGRELEYICAYKKIMLLQRPLAITEVRIQTDLITEAFQYEIPEGSMIIFDMKNAPRRVLAANGKADPRLDGILTQQDFYKEMRAGYMELSQELASGIGRVSMFIPKDLIYKDLKIYIGTILGIFVLVSAILFISVEVVSYFLTKKLERLFKKMNTNVEHLVNNENSDIYTSDDEFGTIGNMSHELILKVKEYYRKITEYENERAVLETQLLQERINPHFLYNTLSTMKWLSEDKRIQGVIDSMVKYYRIALNKGSTIITINQEMEMITEYMKLQKFAYGKEFDFEITMEPGVENGLILKHLLQPVVENALIHGLNNCEAGGLIKIDAVRTEGVIDISISDNGSGMEPEKLEKLLQGDYGGVTGGYGMRNIQKRMEVFYGEGFGMDVESRLNAGTAVRIRIPCRMDSDAYKNMR